MSREAKHLLKLQNFYVPLIMLAILFLIIIHEPY